jgi:hypothetical protein
MSVLYGDSKDFRDIYEGDLLSVWRDSDRVFMKFPNVAIDLPIESFLHLLVDFKELIETVEESI